MKDQKYLTIGLVGVLVFYLFTMNGFSRNKIESLERQVDRLELAYNQVLDELETISRENRLISDTSYNVESIVVDHKTLAKANIEIESSKLGSYTDVQLVYRKSYDSTLSKTYDYSNEKWQSSLLVNDNGTFQTQLTLPYSCDYELKLAFKEGEVLNYYKIPGLPLYSKSEARFMKDINFYKFKNNKLEFDVQIATFNKDIDVSEIECNVINKNEIINTFDVVKENEVTGRKEPKKQLEHIGGNYWFMVKDVDLSQYDSVIEEDISVELIIRDSLGNEYRLIENM